MPPSTVTLSVRIVNAPSLLNVPPIVISDASAITEPAEVTSRFRVATSPVKGE